MPDLTTEMAATWAPTLALVVARITAMLLVAPVFSHPAVPIRLRVGFAIVIGLAVVARMAGPAPAPAGVLELALGLGGEVAIGATLGYAAKLLFVGLELGALHIGQQMGLGLAGMFHPGAEGGAAPVAMLRLLGVVFFLGIGGHRDLLAALMKSFRSVPLRSFVPGSAAVALIADLLAASFVVAMKLAAPLLIAMLLATAALGMLQKTLPQCNLLSTNLPLRAMLGMLLLAWMLAAMMSVMATGWAGTLQRIGGFLDAAATR